MAMDISGALMKICSTNEMGTATHWWKLMPIQDAPITRNILFVVGHFGIAFVSVPGNAQSLLTEQPGVQPVAPITAWRFTPQIRVEETYTDNGELVPSPSARKNRITDSALGIRIEKTGVRSRLYFDYRLHDFRYSKNTRLNNTQRLLNSYLTVAVIDKWLYVDASANITQQNRSAFGVAAATDASDTNGNRIETTTNQLSPYIRGKVAAIAAYQLRFVGADIRSNDIALPDTKGKQWTGFIKSESVGSGFGWSVDGNAISFRNKIVGTAHDERVRVSFSYAFSSQIHISVIGGSEATNFAGTRNGERTSGLGLEWSPGARTQFAAVKEKRFFGESHRVSFSHRTALTAWKFTSAKDVSSFFGQLTGGGGGSTASLLSDLLVSAIPDPIAREAAVRQSLKLPESPAIQH